MKLLSESNTKILKGEKLGVKTFILHLAPFNLSGYQVCPKASLGCSLACLNTAGMSVFDNVQAARIEKTKFFFEERAKFMAQLVKEIRSGIKKAVKANMIPAFRLNGTSDLPWEKIRVTDKGIEYRNVMELFSEVQFYDYTAIVGRTVPDNYHLTFSRKESNQEDVVKAIKSGLNVTVVFDKKKTETLPTEYLGVTVIDGDESDVRFFDPKNVIVGLKLKGNNRMKQSARESGFAV